MKKRPERPFLTIFLMKIHEKEAGMAVSYDFSHEFSWKEAETAISYYFSHEFSWKEAKTAISYDFSHEKDTKNWAN